MNVRLPSVREIESLLLRTPYVEGGRSLGEGLDCVGVVLVVAFHLGLHLVDPWEQLACDYHDGLKDPGSCFPPGWCITGDDRCRDGDVLVSDTGVAIAVDGYAWTAHRNHGVYRRPAGDVLRQARELWRFRP